MQGNRTKYDYTLAEQLYEQGMNYVEISNRTGLKWNTLYSHFNTNKYRREHNEFLWEYYFDYKKHLDELLAKLTSETGITNWMSDEGQAILQRYEAVRE
jgi:hypothetical protein